MSLHNRVNKTNEQPGTGTTKVFGERLVGCIIVEHILECSTHKTLATKRLLSFRRPVGDRD